MANIDTVPHPADNPPLQVNYQPTSHNNFILWLIITLLLAILIVLVAMLTIKKTPATKPAEDKPTLYTSPVPVESVVNVNSLIPTVSSSSAASSSKSVVIAYVPSGKFTSELKAQLEANVLNPFIDYYQDPSHNNPNKLVSVTVEYQEPSDKNPPTPGYYTITVEGVFDNGGTVGFLVAKNKEGTAPALWVPECMMECVFSDAYKARHPKTVEEYKKVSGM